MSVRHPNWAANDTADDVRQISNRVHTVKSGDATAAQKTTEQLQGRKRAKAGALAAKTLGRQQQHRSGSRTRPRWGMACSSPRMSLQNARSAPSTASSRPQLQVMNNAPPHRWRGMAYARENTPLQTSRAADRQPTCQRGPSDKASCSHQVVLYQCIAGALYLPNTFQRKPNFPLPSWDNWTAVLALGCNGRHS